MIRAEDYNEIQKARMHLAVAGRRDVDGRMKLADACKQALNNGATLTDVGQILEVSPKHVRKIARRARFENSPA